MPPDTEKEARHRAIASRYKKQQRQRVSTKAGLRTSELLRLFRARYLGSFPDDDAGRRDLDVLLDFAPFRPGATVHSVARLIASWATWLTEPEAQRTAERAFQRRRRYWLQDELAREVGLTYSERTRLKIRTIGAIDVTKAQRDAIQREKKKLRDRERQRKRRAEKGPTGENLSRTKPWLALGVSRSKWYEMRRKSGWTKKSPHNDDPDNPHDDDGDK